MPLAGRQLSIASALAACRAAGFSGRDEVVDAVCVMCAESALYVKAYHENLKPNGEVDSTDRGLFQINDKWHPDLSIEDALMAAPNVVYARGMVVASGGFNPWAAYKSGAHEKFRADVEKVYDKGTWRLRVPLWETRMAAL